MQDLYNIIKRPIVTEKTGDARTKWNKVTLEVNMNANKIEVKQAVEKIFGVKVINVNTSISHGKYRRVRLQRGLTSARKKAIVTLAKGQIIPAFEM